MKYNITKLEKEDFPEKLKAINDCPKALYLMGNKDLLFEDCFGIVGTRKITQYGIENCKFFTKELVFRNIPIVSGMAIGTDTVAHTTTLEYGGKTIAVLGSGFNNVFPKENLELFNKIIEMDGLVLTEFEENEKPLKVNFPKRNRIITALSEGVLVIEAAYRSGTSITVKNAKKQGKLVFALPGKLDSYVGVGVNNMIKEGAFLTTKVEDIVSKYPQFENRKRITKLQNNIKSVKIKDEYKEIYDILKDKELYLDEILALIDLEIKDVLKILTNMELEELINQDENSKYKIK